MRFLFVIALIAVTACSPGVKRMQKPDNLIPHDKMVVLLTEMIKLEGHATTKYVQVTRYHKMMVASGDSLIQAHGFTPKQYETSMEYYAYEQKELKRMYEEVLENLNREMTELELEHQKSDK